MILAPPRNGDPDRIAQREHVRTMRMQRHLTLAGLTCVLGIVIGPAVHRLLGLMILLACTGAVLGSLARAADARLGHWWGWLYGEPVYSTWLDLFICAILRRFATGSAPDTVDNEPKIRILPVEPSER
jgi:hypothetical protein